MFEIVVFDLQVVLCFFRWDYIYSIVAVEIVRVSPPKKKHQFKLQLGII